MSVDAASADDEPATCAHCGTADETVRESYLAPIGNLEPVAACAQCRRRFGTVEPVEAVGPVHGLTAPDGVCLVCGGEGEYALEQELPVAGTNGYLAGYLCAEHATAGLDVLLEGATEGQQ